MAKPNPATTALASDPELAELYGSYTGAAAKEDAAKVAKTDYVKLNNGRSIIRILPGPKGSTSPFVEVWQHYLKNAAGNMVVVNCPQKMAGLYCPVCDHVETLKHSEVQADKDTAKDFGAKRQIFCYAFHRNPGSKEDKALGILRVPFGVYSQILAMRTDAEVIEAFETNTGREVDRDEGVDFTHPIFGFDIIIEKTGQGLNTKYSAQPRVLGVGKTPAMEDVEALKEALKKRPDMGALAKLLTEGEISGKLNSLMSGSSEETAEGDQKALPEGPKAEAEMYNTTATDVPTDANGNKIPF